MSDILSHHELIRAMTGFADGFTGLDEILAHDAALRAEVARLRAALEDIAAQTDGYKGWTWEDRVCRIARAALAKGA